MPKSLKQIRGKALRNLEARRKLREARFKARGYAIREAQKKELETNQKTPSNQPTPTTNKEREESEMLLNDDSDDVNNTTNEQENNNDNKEKENEESEDENKNGE
jgi:hypothetical protein